MLNFSRLFLNALVVSVCIATAAVPALAQNSAEGVQAYRQAVRARIIASVAGGRDAIRRCDYDQYLAFRSEYVSAAADYVAQGTDKMSNLLRRMSGKEPDIEWARLALKLEWYKPPSFPA